MDTAGRLVVPKEIRRTAGLLPGMPLAITLTDGGIEIAPLPRQVRTVRRGKLTVAEPIEEGPRLTAETVRETQSIVRRRR